MIIAVDRCPKPYCTPIYIFYLALLSSNHIRYGLVARICRSHQSSSLPSAGKARVRFPVSEFLLFALVLYYGEVAVVGEDFGGK
jgi:hypothetical protein